MILESELLAQYPAEITVPAGVVAERVEASAGVLIVLDDDPTGTQSVANLPVLTEWEVSDFDWAFNYRIDGQAAKAVYVQTNTRSLDPAETETRNRDIVSNAISAAHTAGVSVGFASRSDSTLRGHFPLETDTIVNTLAAQSGVRVDGVVMVPAFPDAGRITIGGVHYTRGPGGTLIPVSQTEFAKDVSFGFTHSALAEYVQEKSGGRIPASTVLSINLQAIRQPTPEAGAAAIADILTDATEATVIVVDAVTDNDLRILALGLEESARRGKNLIYRVGPAFVRARIGQDVPVTLEPADIFGSGKVTRKAVRGGLIVVGSHVGVTSRQLAALTQVHENAAVFEIDVAKLLADDGGDHLSAVVRDVIDTLATKDVVIHTSRELIKTDDPAANLQIARTVSAALVEVVSRTLSAVRPRFVIAKGGITSSDVAAYGLKIRHAVVRGPLLPGIVSLWEPVDGPAQGIPYIVFPGNVGDDNALLSVTRKLSNTF
ncbi:MAG: hypothetical protein HIU81_03210 [Acidobacteria bacterium]|nr:hypothetical protein [Acidobacteriota bacterium]